MSLLPPLLLACFAFWSGTFPGAAAFPSGPVGQGLVLAAALLGAAAWRDPLRLGPAGRWLSGALLAAVALSLWASPVARAGRVGALLLPAYLLLPPFVARCWSTGRRREIGLAAWSAVVAATAVWALVEQVRQGTPRSAMPLGHHNLLAAFLVITLPLVVPALRRRGPARWMALAAVVAAVVALVEARSFVAGAALALLALVGAARFERARHLVLGLAFLGLALLVPRAAAIVRGEDSSAAARQVYLLAGWQGATERPIAGWGPGSTPWTLAEHLRPLPGVNPAGEVVGEMHSLPLALAYELGFVGLALAVAVTGLFFFRRWRGCQAAVDRGLVEAGLAGVAGFLLSALGGAQLSVTALPLAAALAAGAALSGEGAPDRPSRQDGRPPMPGWRFDFGSGFRSGSTSQRRSSSCCRSPVLTPSTKRLPDCDREPRALRSWRGRRRSIRGFRSTAHAGPGLPLLRSRSASKRRSLPRAPRGESRPCGSAPARWRSKAGGWTSRAKPSRTRWPSIP